MILTGPYYGKLIITTDLANIVLSCLFSFSRAENSSTSSQNLMAKIMILEAVDNTCAERSLDIKMGPDSTFPSHTGFGAVVVHVQRLPIGWCWWLSQDCLIICAADST